MLTGSDVMMKPPTERMVRIATGFIHPADARRLAILGIDTDTTDLNIEIFARAAC
jgi:hypothetical protein